ncbi:hypothetical protein [Pulveribacter suum]|uniref:hypothetical protein n=1 Tax=Pulveribacter suum TaxID=2116657 RepID=UPI0013006036|nr:hypothetical protein [Pulveribacter suum]
MNDSKSDANNTEWTSAVGAALLITLLLSLALISAGSWNWFKGFIESAAPAWIQAIGSVAAIVAASVIARHQVHAARRLELRKQAYVEVQKLKIVLALMVRALNRPGFSRHLGASNLRPNRRCHDSEATLP